MRPAYILVELFEPATCAVLIYRIFDVFLWEPLHACIVLIYGIRDVLLRVVQDTGNIYLFI